MEEEENLGTYFLSWLPASAVASRLHLSDPECVAPGPSASVTPAAAPAPVSTASHLTLPLLQTPALYASLPPTVRGPVACYEQEMPDLPSGH